MLSFIKTIQNKLLNLNTNEKQENSTIIFNKSVPIDNNSKLYDEINNVGIKILMIFLNYII